MAEKDKESFKIPTMQSYKNPTKEYNFLIYQIDKIKKVSWCPVLVMKCLCVFVYPYILLMDLKLGHHFEEQFVCLNTWIICFLAFPSPSPRM